MSIQTQAQSTMPAVVHGMDLKRPLILLFLFALVVRLAYLWLVFDDTSSLLVGDSQAYIGMARDLFDEGLSSWSLTERVPGYMFVLAAAKVLLGSNYLLGTVILQCITDAFSCVLIAVLARMLRPGLAIPAGLLAAINLNLTVHAGLILNDSLFLTMFLGFLCSWLMVIRTRGTAWALGAGLILGACILMRSVAMFLPGLLLLFVLLPARDMRERLLPPVLAMLACASLTVPWIVHNGMVFGRYQLVSQGGVHLAFWVVPLTKEYGAGIPSAQTIAEMRQQAARRIQDTGAGAVTPFTQSDIMSEVAGKALKEAGILVLAKAWAVGGVINLMAPPILSSPPVSIINRPSFFATTGATPLDKVLNYLGESNDRTFILLLVSSVLVLAAQMAITLLGILGAARHWPRASLATLTIVLAYFVAITGPVTGVKYRLPLEPLLIVLMAEGVMVIWGRVQRRRVAK